MADKTTNLTQLAEAQAGKATTVNELIDACSPGSYYGRRAPACVGFTWAGYGAVILIGSTPTRVANWTVTLGASVTTYIEANPATGAVTSNTSGWTSGRTPLYKVTTSATAVTDWQDWRCMSFATLP